MDWIVSANSHKAAHCPENVLDEEDLTTYWQSDGNGPHFLSFNLIHQFYVATKLRVYFEYKTDESYCPSRISLYAGEHHTMLMVCRPTINLSQSAYGH